MPEATDRLAVTVHGAQFAMVVGADCRDVVKEDARVNRWFGLQIAEDHLGLGSAVRTGNECPQRVPESGAQGMTTVTDHQDDVGVNTTNDMLPTNPVTTQDSIVIVLDAAARVRCCLVESIFYPLTRQFPGNNGWVEADNLDLVPVRKCRWLARPRLGVNVVTVVSLMAVVTMLSPNFVNASYRWLLGGRWDFHPRHLNKRSTIR